MAWTSPSTWVSGAILTAAQLNTQIRDNLLALSTWTNYTPTWTNVTLGTTGLVNVGQYSQAGKIVTVRFRLVLGTGGALTGGPNMSLPVAPAAIGGGFMALGQCVMDDTTVGVAGRRVGVVIQANVSTQFYVADDAASRQVATSTPFTWAAGDTLAGTLTYEAA